MKAKLLWLLTNYHGHPEAAEDLQSFTSTKITSAQWQKLKERVDLRRWEERE